MQLRVVVDQPWDVPADVLAVPFIGEPRFQGPLAEIDKPLNFEMAATADMMRIALATAPHPSFRKGGHSGG